jgi:IS605 OrfB family transposase
VTIKEIDKPTIYKNVPLNSSCFDYIQSKVSIKPIPQPINKIMVNAPFIRTYKINLYPTQKQLDLIKLWLDDVIDVYNFSVLYITSLIQFRIDRMVNNFIIINKCKAIDRKIFSIKSNANKPVTIKRRTKKVVATVDKQVIDPIDKKISDLNNQLALYKRELDIAVQNNKKQRRLVTDSLNFINIRAALKDKISVVQKINNCDPHTLDQAVQRCIAMFRSAFTNFSKGNIPNFKLKPLKKSDNRKQLYVERDRIDGDNLVSRLFVSRIKDPIASSRKLKDFKEKMCILQYNKSQNTTYLLCPMEIKPKSKPVYIPKVMAPITEKAKNICNKIIKRAILTKKVKEDFPPKIIERAILTKKVKEDFPPKIIKPIVEKKAKSIENNTKSICNEILVKTENIKPIQKVFKRKAHRNEFENTFEKKPKCGIDMGIRTFLSCYDGDTTIEICNKETSYPVIEAYIKKLERYKRYMLAGTLSRNRYKKLRNRVQTKMRNRIDDMHNKVASFLTKHYQVINIGNVSVKSITSKKNNMTPINKKICLTLSLYRFRKKLEEYGERRGCIVNVVSEYMTSKRCSECGAINDMKGSKEYICSKCDLKIDRDTNAAKNIWKIEAKAKRKAAEKRNAITRKKKQ